MQHQEPSTWGNRQYPRLREGLEQLMTLSEVAKTLRVSEKTVRRLVARGFPHVRFGRVLRFEQADVQRWLAARRH